MKLLQQLGVAPQAKRPPERKPDSYGREPVGHSADLNRVIAVPRRDLETSYPAYEFSQIEARLRKTGPCVCAKQGRPCPTSLKPIQAQALIEAARAGGLFAPIGVGHGKTLVDLLLPMVLPECKTAVLFIPANLKTQLLERDWDYYGGHWRLPNLQGGRWFEAGRPVLHVVTYNILSRPESSDLMRRINPDTIICDEAHNLKARTSSRTIRFARYFEEHPETRLCVLSGTMTSRTIRDCSHLACWSLGDASPYPTAPHVVEDWSNALDPCSCVAAKNPDASCLCRAHPGALLRLCEPGEHVREGFRRRRVDTLGVVATSESAIGTSLVIRPRMPGPVPPEILTYIKLAKSGERPDTERFQSDLESAACTRQLSAGFYHRWKYPRGEPRKLIDEWFAKRKAWNAEVWDELKNPEEHLDSPGLLTKAAIRAYMDPPYDGDRPVWAAMNWPAWVAIHDQVQPVPEAVWISDYVVQDAADWARENVGIVWVEFPELGEAIAKEAGIPYFGGGDEASKLIPLETGKRSIVASIRAHGTGKNLQMFYRNLVVTPPADAAIWEQMIARTHRPGQLADEVTVDVVQHTAPYRDAFSLARERARFLEQVEGPQKLMMADYCWA